MSVMRMSVRPNFTSTPELALNTGLAAASYLASKFCSRRCSSGKRTKVLFAATILVDLLAVRSFGSSVAAAKGECEAVQEVTHQGGDLDQGELELHFDGVGCVVSRARGRLIASEHASQQALFIGGIQG